MAKFTKSDKSFLKKIKNHTRWFDYQDLKISFNRFDEDERVVFDIFLNGNFRNEETFSNIYQAKFFLDMIK